MTKTYYCVYILICRNGSFYTGYTTDIVRRYEEHVAGIGSKYTRSFKPLRIAQYWQIHGDKAAAMRMENFIKKLSRVKKQQLLLNPGALSQRFFCQPMLNQYS